eukprot:751362-Hanusia_phi.AAC.1
MAWQCLTRGPASAETTQWAKGLGSRSLRRPSGFSRGRAPAAMRNSKSFKSTPVFKPTDPPSFLFLCNEMKRINRYIRCFYAWFGGVGVVIAISGIHAVMEAHSHL